MKNQSKEIIVRPLADLQKSIDGFNEPLARYLQEIGLPTQDVLYSIDERKQVINALQDVLSVLPLEQREKSYYLTKFTVAIAVGLFDGAMNYLWNETIAALRRLVLKFELEYFFSIAEKISSRHKNLATEEDLDQIGDHDLLEACRRIGLLSDVNYQRLVHVNYMRNHASAAHPNDHQIDGFEMLGWLRVCLRHAITAEPDHSAISVKRLLDNLRTVPIPVDDIPAIGEDIARMPKERIDDLLWTIFGIYTDPQLAAQTKSNIANLAPYVWPASSEDRKFEIGARYGVFRKNVEVIRKEATEKFLRIVGGLQYRDEDSLAGELIDKLETLKRVHFGWDNFYNEHPHARALQDSLPTSGLVPRAARTPWVKVISIGYIGNGLGYREGVDEAAVRYYSKYIDRFTEAETVEFLHLFNDAEFNSILGRKKTEERAKMLAKHIKGNQSNIHIQRVLDLIINTPQGTLYKVANTTEFKNALVYVPKHK
jgi:hypothetical protein